MQTEAEYQNKLIKNLHASFPDAFILGNDPSEVQGLPDILILFKDMWAMLEVKASSSSNIQPNQNYYIEMFNDMSFAAFIYPENEEQVLRELKSAFGVNR